jgi:hypothetical protein
LSSSSTTLKYLVSTIKKPDIYYYESLAPKTENKDSDKYYNYRSLKYFVNICPKPKKLYIVDIRKLEEEVVAKSIDILESENSDA